MTGEAHCGAVVIVSNPLSLSPSDMWSQKAASNEIRAASALMDANIPDLHVPLTALFVVVWHSSC